MATAADLACLDTDTLSAISRGQPAAAGRAEAYLARHRRFTFTAVTVAERLRGYHAALRAGKPYATQLAEFELVVATSAVLPLDAVAGALAGRIAATLRRRAFTCDLLIGAIAATQGLPLVTGNRDDFALIAALPFVHLTLVDWMG